MGLWIRSGGRHAQGLGTAGRWGHARGPCTGSRHVQPAEAAVRGVWLRNFRAAESDVSQGDAQDVGVCAGTSRSRGAWAGPGPTAALGGLSAARGPARPGGSRPTRTAAGRLTSPLVHVWPVGRNAIGVFFGLCALF